MPSPVTVPWCPRRLGRQTWRPRLGRRPTAARVNRSTDMRVRSVTRCTVHAAALIGCCCADRARLPWLGASCSVCHISRAVGESSPFPIRGAARVASASSGLLQGEGATGEGVMPVPPGGGPGVVSLGACSEPSFMHQATSASRSATDPTIIEPTDAIVRTVAACVCGSDLWRYRGIQEVPQADADRPRVRRHRRGRRRRRHHGAAGPVRRRRLPAPATTPARSAGRACTSNCLQRRRLRRLPGRAASGSRTPTARCSPPRSSRTTTWSRACSRCPT